MNFPVFVATTLRYIHLTPELEGSHLDAEESSQLIALLVCVVGAGITSTGAFAIALWCLYDRFILKNRRRLSNLERIVLASGTAVVICFLYALLVEPFWLDIAHITIRTAKLTAKQGFRIAHISDLHCDPQVRLEKLLPEKVAEEKPDVILFTGDAINSANGLANFRTVLQQLYKIAPTFVVKGNWDSWYWYKLDLFSGTGATELNGSTQKLQLGGVDVSLSGLSVPARDANAAPEPGIERALKELSGPSFSIFLYHYPDLIPNVAAHNIDLYLSGHTHGGQVRLPWYGAVITLSKFGKKYEAGLYKEGNTALYVNRGIGMEGGRAPRIRFLCRPELTIIDVKSAQAD